MKEFMAKLEGTRTYEIGMKVYHKFNDRYLDYRYKILRAAIRLNYEKYWYDHSVKPSRGNGDMLTAELIVKF